MDASDEEDLRIFRSSEDRGFACKIICIKYDDPEVTKLVLKEFNDLDERASARLGSILGRNTSVEDFRIHHCTVDIPALCAGLKNNRHIRAISFLGVDLHDAEVFSHLAPFLCHNPSLKNRLSLCYCNIGPAGVDILSTALLNRTEDPLPSLDLGGNGFGDINLDQLVLALSRKKEFRRLYLDGNGIGRKGCTSLAKLLKDQESNLSWLWLQNNDIDDECVLILADSLVKNTKLARLELGTNNGITAVGWSAILALVCNSSSIGAVTNSNHTLCIVGSSVGGLKDCGLGVNDDNLLRASTMNANYDTKLVTRRKILWAHARGDLSIGDSGTISLCDMLCYLVWLGDDADETNANLIQYHDPPLSKAKLDTIRLDSTYRILRSQPILMCTSNFKSGSSIKISNLCNENKELHVNIKSLQDDNKLLSAKLGALLNEMKDSRNEIMDLSGVNEENKSLAFMLLVIMLCLFCSC